MGAHSIIFSETISFKMFMASCFDNSKDEAILSTDISFENGAL
jgi:hypothetical protein